MNEKLNITNEYDIDIATYDWSVKVFRSLKKMLKVNLKLHADSQIEQGDIFLFNHFSRFETFIPQYLIYEETGAYSCAIGSAEFFKEDNVLSRYLKNVCVLPHNHERLFALLAEQIFRGRKVIIFPEGGMVKDRQVLDKHGQYSIYSRIAKDRRKHHTGPAVLAQGLEAFKATIRNAYSNKDYEQLERWKDELHLDGLDQLLMTALKPTLIIPANITFYPIRSNDNLLRKGVELFANKLSLRQTEELLIEGNILLKDTDMDIRMGSPIDPYHVWHWWNRYLLNTVASEFRTLDDVFRLHSSPKSWKQKLLGVYFRKNAEETRNEYMEKIYKNVTINLSHLASTLIMYCLDKGVQSIEKNKFYMALYIAIKRLQKNGGINLHRSLLNPVEYHGLIEGATDRFEHFIEVSETNQLIAANEDSYQFLPKLCEEHDFDTIRMENLIAVYDNEAEPITEVLQAVSEGLKQADSIDVRQLAEYHFDDECLTLKWDQKQFSKPRYDDVNKLEQADSDPSPFLLQPDKANGCGVLLIHGLLASPAEMREYGEYLLKQGYTVLGIRIVGHGTSPYDLRERSYEDWYQSVEKGFAMLKSFTDHQFVIGFSTGGALALQLAAEYPQNNFLGVVALTVPIKFVDLAIMLVPLVHGTNKLVRWISSYEGIKPFIENLPEHPKINYFSTPMRSLFELRRLIQKMEDVLPKITIPTLAVFADKDPVVSIDSAPKLMEKLGAEHKQLEIINAEHHGILMDNTENTWQIIDEFINPLVPA